MACEKRTTDSENSTQKLRTQNALKLFQRTQFNEGSTLSYLSTIEFFLKLHKENQQVTISDRNTQDKQRHK